ncbi:hypothetical protein [Streptomyces sp. NPDC002215]|uniref:hypothetical protein n=1 Tax=Streptomyces sp. NPDC002215 TaxID=3154412 RepID=UPI0033259DA4
MSKSNDVATATIHLHGIGRVPAVFAWELTVGDQLMHDYGGICQITKIEDASPKFFDIVEVSAETGKEYSRRIKKDRLVARVPDAAHPHTRRKEPETMSTPSAGRFLLNALSRAGISAREDGDGASSYIAVPVGAHGLVIISGVSGRARENEINYHPSQHQGWGTVHYPDTKDDDGNFTTFYASADPDLARDTANVIKAVQEVITESSAA